MIFDKEIRLKKLMMAAASEHNSNELKNMVENDDKMVWGDSGYVGKEDEFPEKVWVNVNLIICAKGTPWHLLIDEQKESKWTKSKTRYGIETIFGFMTNSMNEIFLRCIGMKCAKFNIAMMKITRSF